MNNTKQVVMAVMAFCLAGAGAARILAQGSQQDAQAAVSWWPPPTQKAARAFIVKYGQPDEVSDDKLVWDDKRGFARIVVYQDPGPMDRRDFIEHVVRYNVPREKLAEVKDFDPSLFVDSANGTMSARSGSEKSNFLTLNLAHEIAVGTRDGAAAQGFKQKILQMDMSGKSSEYEQKMMFAPQSH